MSGAVSNVKAYAMLSVTAMCWGANALFSRLAAGEVSPMAVVMLRWVGVSILLALFASRYVRRDWAVLRPRLPFLFAMGALGFAGFNAIFYVSGHFTTAVNIGILQGSIPGIVLLGAFLAYGVRITRMQALGVAVTIVGVATVASGGNITDLAGLGVNLGDGLMIIACVLYAGYTVALRDRPATSAMGLFTVLAGAALVTSLPLAAAEYALGYFQWPTPKGWLVVGLITLFPSFLAQIFFIKGVEAIGPGRAGVFVNLVPVFAAVLAVMILSEPFKLYHAVALGLVLGGIWLSERGKPQ
ncbi:MAG: DMT family transporter [Rhodospirillaceae bacterium]|nr:DMT family transporter [Rhodospirillaceae bacterium]